MGEKDREREAEPKKTWLGRAVLVSIDTIIVTA